MDLTTFYIQFRDETAENLRVLNQGLMHLETVGNDTASHREEIDAVFRAMHTIKGSARLLGLEKIGRIAHACEHILSAVREGRRALDRALTDELLRGGDAILELVTATVEGRSAKVDADDLAVKLGRGLRDTAPVEPPPVQLTPQEEPAAPATLVMPTIEAPAPVPAPTTRTNRANRQTVRVRVDRLDRLLNLAGELMVGRQIQVAHLQAIESLETILEQQQKALMILEAEINRLRFSPTQRESLLGHVNSALNAGEQVERTLKTQIERFGQHANQSAQIVEDLEQEVMAVRLLPISTLFVNLPRAIRELARDLGKEVNLNLAGETTELDRKVIEALTDPLTHLLRNAVDHGIEPADERERAGKPRQGTIEVHAQALGSHATVIIHDDGRGMDPVVLRKAAVRKGLLNADTAALLTNQEAVELVFMPGFSTAAMITDVSGRGVGMDVVRTNIVELGGQVLIDSKFGTGTTITLVLPLTLVTTRVLLIEVGEHLFGIPASGCHGTLWVYPDQVKTVEGRAMLPRAGGLAPILRLDELLEIANPREFIQRAPALLIGAAKRPLALLVDRMVDEREVVVKPLGPLMEKQRRYSGAIQLGDGKLALLLNPMTLAQMTRGMALSTATTRTTPAKRPRLLVTDDSFATRELIRSILNTAGYDVTTAVDGLDALDKLRLEPYDLVVSDVEMPRVDGFTLTSRIRTELKKDLPVIIITSLASEAHKRRGLEAGAQAYIVKSQFNQGNLIDTIRQLLSH